MEWRRGLDLNADLCDVTSHLITPEYQGDLNGNSNYQLS